MGLGRCFYNEFEHITPDDRLYANRSACVDWPLDLSPQVSTIHHVNSKHRKTLAAVFSEPTRCDIPWVDIEALLVACGGKLREGSGSRVRIELAGFSAVFHRPHPRTVTDRGSVRSARRFLLNAGVKP